MPAPSRPFYLALDLPIEERVKNTINFVAFNPEYEGAESPLIKSVKFISAVPNHTVFEMLVTPRHCNFSGNMHGGAAATIMDWATTTPLLTIARKGYLDGGHVSRTITMTYLRPVPMGSTVRIECRTVAVGKSTAHMKGEIKTLDGKVCITCEHDKAVFPSKNLPEVEAKL